MANLLNLGDELKKLFSKAGSFIQQNPTPAGFLAKQLPQQIRQPIEQNLGRLRNVDIASTAAGGAMKAYNDTRQMSPLSPQRIVAQNFPIVGAAQNIFSKKPTFASEQIQRAVPGKAGALLGFGTEMLLPGIGGELKAAKGVSGFIKSVAKQAPRSIISGAGESTNLNQIPQYAGTNLLLAGGLTAVSKVAGKMNPNAKGMVFGKNRNTGWSLDESRVLSDSLADLHDNAQKLGSLVVRGEKPKYPYEYLKSRQLLTSIEERLGSLADNHIPNETLKKLAKDYGSNSVGYLKALGEELQNSIKKHEDKKGIVLGIYGGPKAAGFDKSLKDTFSSLADKKVRFEIDDSGAKMVSEKVAKDRAFSRGDEYRKQIDTLQKQISVANRQGNSTLATEIENQIYKLKSPIPFTTVGDVLDHPKLFEQYPELKNYQIEFSNKVDQQGAFVPSKDGGKIIVSKRADGKQSTLLHEIQHAIQEKEGFARGSSPDTELNILNNKKLRYPPLIDPKEQAVIDYNRNAGEIEARDVQSRMNLNPEQRTNTLPYQSQGIPVKDQIVRFDSGAQAQKTPKTVRVWIKSKFSNDGGYADVPVIRKEDNITLYQGSKMGENRQFWTPDKKYAEQFGNVKEKTGSFYKIDNGNRVTDVYVEAPNKSNVMASIDPQKTIPLQQAWEEARAKGIKNPEQLDPDELGNIIDPNYKMSDSTNTQGDKISSLQEDYLKTNKKPTTGGQSNLVNSPKAVGEIIQEQTQVGKTIKPPDPVLPSGQKERGFVRNVRTSDTSAPEVAGQVQGTYKPIGNQKSLTNAQKYVDEVGWDQARKTVAEGPIDANTSSVAQELMRRAQNEGRYDDAVGIAEEIAVRATKAGQFNQAFSMWSRLTPEGMLQHITKSFDDANKKLDGLTKGIRKIRGLDKVKLDPATAEYVKKAMERANKATDDVEKGKIIKEMFEVVNKKLPWGAWDLIDEYRYNNMLSNPLTHLRNLTSNLQQTYLLRPATLAAQGKIPEAVKYEIGALGALPTALTKAFKTFKEGKAIEKLDLEKPDITKFKPQRLPVLLGAPSRMLQSADDFFSTLIQAGEKARGASDAEAFNVARYSLFQQDLKPEGQGILLNKIDDLTRAVYGLRRVGLGWFIPFVKTPMNVAKQWIEYSPAGIATLPGAKNKKEQVAKFMIGSLVTLVGAKLATEDRTTWSAPTDPTAKELFYASGKKPFSVKIGDMWVPMQAFGSLAYAMALPAAVKQYQEDSRTALTDSQIEKLTQAAMGGLQFFSQQTFVTGLGSFVNLARGDVDFTLPKNIAYTAGQLIPLAGLQRYIANIIDPIYRKPEGVVEQIKSGIPFLTKSIQPYTDPYGEPSKRLPENNVLPYAVGKQNNEFEEPYQMRMQQLQQNNLLNKMKKQAEKGDYTMFDKAQAAEAPVVDPKEAMKNKFALDSAKTKVEISGNPQIVGNKYVYLNENGNSVTKDLTFTPKTPKLTGIEEIDKNLISEYKSSITSRIKDIGFLLTEEVKTKEEAVQELNELMKLKNGLSGSSGSGKGKKLTKISFKKVTPKPVKFVTSKRKNISNIKFKKPPKPKTLKLKGGKAVQAIKLKPIQAKKIKGLEASVRLV